ncbi:MAG: hypothetical protein L0H23_01900 [Luteimonas sp.]|nr:hypothetical protein [Luteimonas sp.]
MRWRNAIVVPLLLLLGACATNRSYLSLDVPATPVRVDAGKVAVIETVSDARLFEADPDEPSTPSLKKGEKYSLDAEGRKSAIARKRNGYGMAIGDILLQPPATVETITRELVAAGLQQQGYRIAPAGDAPADALKVKVTIKEFWAWFTPGFWAVEMEARLKTLLQFEGATTSEVEVSGYGSNAGQSGRATNWKQAYDRAFEDYLEKQKAAFDQADL